MPARRPEILAPAGDLESLQGRARRGADAVYFGLDEGFNARARAGELRARRPGRDGRAHPPRRRARLPRRSTRWSSSPSCPSSSTLLRAGRRGGGRRADRAGSGGRAAGARALSRARAARQHADDDLERRGRALRRRAWAICRVVVPRELSVEEIRSWPGTDARARGLHPRRALRVVERAVPDQRGVGRPLGQPRPVRAVVPPAVRARGRRRRRASSAT